MLAPVASQKTCHLPHGTSSGLCVSLASRNINFFSVLPLACSGSVKNPNDYVENHGVRTVNKVFHVILIKTSRTKRDQEKRSSSSLFLESWDSLWKLAIIPQATLINFIMNSLKSEEKQDIYRRMKNEERCNPPQWRNEMGSNISIHRRIIKAAEERDEERQCIPSRND